MEWSNKLGLSVLSTIAIYILYFSIASTRDCSKCVVSLLNVSSQLVNLTNFMSITILNISCPASAGLVSYITYYDNGMIQTLKH